MPILFSLSHPLSLLLPRHESCRSMARAESPTYTYIFIAVCFIVYYDLMYVQLHRTGAGQPESFYRETS